MHKGNLCWLNNNKKKTKILLLQTASIIESTSEEKLLHLILFARPGKVQNKQM